MTPFFSAVIANMAASGALDAMAPKSTPLPPAPAPGPKLYNFDLMGLKAVDPLAGQPPILAGLSIGNKLGALGKQPEAPAPTPASIPCDTCGKSQSWVARIKASPALQIGLAVVALIVARRVLR